MKIFLNSISSDFQQILSTSPSFLKYELFKFKKPNRLPIKMKFRNLKEKTEESSLNLQIGTANRHLLLPEKVERQKLLPKPAYPKGKTSSHSLKYEFNLLNITHLKAKKQTQILLSIRDKKLFLFALSELIEAGVFYGSISEIIKYLPNTAADKTERGLRRLLVDRIASKGDYSTASHLSQIWDLKNSRRVLSLALVNSKGNDLAEIIDQLVYSNEKLTCAELIYTLENLDTSNDNYKQLFMDAISRFPSNGHVAKLVADAFLNINGSGRELSMKIVMMMDKKVLESESLQVYILNRVDSASFGKDEDLEQAQDPMDKINLLSYWTRNGIKVSPQAIVCAAEGRWKSTALGLEYIKRNVDFGNGIDGNSKNHSLITQRLINMLLLSSHTECSLTDYDTLLELQLLKSPVMTLGNLKNFARLAIERHSTSRIESLVKLTHNLAYDLIREKFMHYLFREMTRVNTPPAGVIGVYEVCRESIKSNPGIIFFMLLSLRSTKDLEYLHKVIMLVRGRVDGDLVEKVFGPWLEGFGGNEELKVLVKEILIHDL